MKTNKKLIFLFLFCVLACAAFAQIPDTDPLAEEPDIMAMEIIEEKENKLFNNISGAKVKI